ncbi:hypothetical protein K2X83_03170 [Patescibacteria group bacterium]|nr:hypothetical protein [Patescibacteria group bacterium]
MFKFRSTGEEAQVLKDVFQRLQSRLGISFLIVAVNAYALQTVDVRIAGVLLLVGFLVGYWFLARTAFSEKNQFFVVGLGVVIAEIIFLVVQQYFIVELLPALIVSSLFFLVSGFLLGHAFARVAKMDIEARLQKGVF